jgi:hypothetical protein
MGYRPFIDSPLDIDMIDSMILWIWIWLYFRDSVLFLFCIFLGLNEPGVFWGWGA